MDPIHFTASTALRRDSEGRPSERDIDAFYAAHGLTAFRRIEALGTAFRARLARLRGGGAGAASRKARPVLG